MWCQGYGDTHVQLGESIQKVVVPAELNGYVPVSGGLCVSQLSSSVPSRLMTKPTQARAELSQCCLMDQDGFRGP